MKPFDGLFGDASAGNPLTEAEMRQVVMRAERRQRYGRPAAGVAEMRERASTQSELTRQIGAALEARDIVSAQALIREGAALFGHDAMLAAVEAQARQDADDRLDAAREPYHRVDDAWFDDRDPYAEEY